MKISEYVQGPWLGFSSQNNLRSLPSIKDGQILTTRKLLHSLNGVNEFEVVERLGLKAAAMTAYKNAGDSINKSLAGMVKSFPGTNNAPLFDGEGQFGTAVENDSSEPRYISAKIAESFRWWFQKEDDAILPRRVERGDTLEPWWYAPVAPLALVNGAFGIGTGYACNLYQHNPLEVINAVLEVMQDGEVTTRLVPWWKGWKGKFEADPTNRLRFFVTGCFERVNSSEIRITELPPCWNNDRYRTKVIIPVLDNNEDILRVDNDSNKFDGWNITVKFKRGAAAKMSDAEIISMFQLKDSICHVLSLWGVDDRITPYSNVEKIVEDWTVWRVGVYEARRKSMISRLEGAIKWENVKLLTIKTFLANPGVLDEGVVSGIAEAHGYGQDEVKKLLDIPLRALTADGVAKGEVNLGKLAKELEVVKGTFAEQMMMNELLDLKSKYEKDPSFLR